MTVDELWEFADANKDNKISFDEFKPLYELIHCQIMKKQQQERSSDAQKRSLPPRAVPGAGTPYDPPKYDPCCSALANQKCQYGYCLRAVG